VRVFFVSVNAILNLWAPGAFWFDVPCALSFRLPSSFGVTKDSVTNRPTLYDGVLVYLSKIKVCSATSTWKPLM